MDLRKIVYLALVCLGLSSQAFAQNSFLFQLPGAGSGNSRALGFFADTADLNADVDTTGPLNARRVLATPDGQRIYVVGETAIQYFNAGLQNLQIGRAHV